MPATYTLISSTTLTTAQATVVFSSIPQTYTDLEFRLSVRGTSSATIRNTRFTVNGTNTGSYTLLQGTNGTAVSSSGSAQAHIQSGITSAATATADTFSSHSIYIPNYAGSTTKPMSVYSAMENNSTTDFYLETYAILQNQTTAITNITFAISGNYAIGSSFYLYGISNA
jgi:hypothetical protein